MSGTNLIFAPTIAMLQLYPQMKLAPDLPTRTGLRLGRRSMTICVALGLTSLLALASPLSAQDAPVKTDQEVAPTGSKESRLAAYLSGAKFVGNFTVSGQESKPLNPETYYILSAEKMDDGDWWKITVRIKYGDFDSTMPWSVEVKWAGETPVFTVDQMVVPGMGTFDARVVLRHGKYAGTWGHNDVSGHLFGTIEKMTDAELKEVREAADKRKNDKGNGR